MVLSTMVIGMFLSGPAWSREVGGTASVTVTVDLGSVGATKATGNASFTGRTSRGAAIEGHGPITLFGSHHGDTFRVRRLTMKFRGQVSGTEVKGQGNARRSTGSITAFTDDEELIDFVLRGRGSLEFSGDGTRGTGV